MPEKTGTAQGAPASNHDARNNLQQRIQELEKAVERLKAAQEECDWILQGEQAARASIEKSNQSFDLILESISDGFLAVDTDWRISHANDNACLILNRPKGRLLGKSVWGELPRSISEILHDPAHEAITAKRPASLEAFFAQRARWYEYRLFPSPEGLYIFFKDITNRKKAEEEQGLLSAIVNFSDDAIMAVTVDGIITYWSPGAERMYGYRESEMAGKSISVIIPPELQHESQLFMDLLKEFEKEKGGVSFETVRVAKDGTRINISVRFSPIKDPAGNHIGISVVHRDITGLKKMEEELGRLQQKEAS